MVDKGEVLRMIAAIAAEADELRAAASQSLRRAVGNAADRGLTQAEIARATGRSQPEISRLIKSYRAERFSPHSALGEALASHRDEIVDVARSHNVSNIRVFGSVARGQEDASSDIDLLVDLTPGADLFDLAALDIELERLLGCPVDIVPARMLKHHVARAALAEAVPL